MNVEELQKYANFGIAEAQYELGFCYENGFGVEIDLAEAKRWYQNAAEKRFSAAQYELSKIISSENPERLDLSIFWLQQASSNGFAPAQLLISIYYEGGIGLKENREQAFQFCLMAATQGYAPAFRRVALMYETGNGVDIDIQQAISWHELAAQSGDADSYASLGRFYSSGLGVKRDIQKAIEFLLKGEQSESPWACFALASIYRFEDLEQPEEPQRADELETKAQHFLELRRRRSCSIA